LSLTPGLISTHCIRRGEFDYLALRLNAVPADPRTDELGGQIIRRSGADLSWVLHLLDVDHAIGTLIRTVGRQAETYLAEHRPTRISPTFR
jgi:hypothetical protein